MRHVARVKKKGFTQNNDGNSEGKNLFTLRVLTPSVKMAIEESILYTQKYDGVDWINLAREGNMWRSIMSTALYFWMQKKIIL